MPSLRDEIGDFVGIPILFLEDEQQTAESRVVFMILRYHTNRKRKRAFPGYETIMREAGLSRQKTAAGLDVLERTGWLVKHRKFARKTEYELRYPSAAYSSTEELRETAPIVPPANVVSSTMERPPLNINNKIEDNKIARAREPVFSIEELKDSDKIPGLRNQLSIYPDVPFDDGYASWFGKYFPKGGIGRAPGSKCTLAQYAAHIESYFRTWQRNAESRNGNGHKQGEDDDWDYHSALVAPEKPVDYFDKQWAEANGR